MLRPGKKEPCPNILTSGKPVSLNKDTETPWGMEREAPPGQDIGQAHERLVGQGGKSDVKPPKVIMRHCSGLPEALPRTQRMCVTSPSTA